LQLRFGIADATPTSIIEMQFITDDDFAGREPTA
jgi:hypothetical protein